MSKRDITGKVQTSTIVFDSIVVIDSTNRIQRSSYVHLCIPPTRLLAVGDRRGREGAWRLRKRMDRTG